MANISRYDPFSLTRTGPFGDIDDLFKGFFMRPVMFEGQPQMQIKMDVKEDDSAYTVHADIPGVKKEDIQVNIEGNQVSISAETKMEKEEKDIKDILTKYKQEKKMLDFKQVEKEVLEFWEKNKIYEKVKKKNLKGKWLCLSFKE